MKVLFVLLAISHATADRNVRRPPKGDISSTPFPTSLVPAPPGAAPGSPAMSHGEELRQESPARDEAPAPSQACFSGESTVKVLGNKGPVPMRSLQVGDMVLVEATEHGRPNKYLPVYAFGHYTPDDQGKFLEVATTTTHNGSPLQITGDHLIFLAGKANPVRADSLNVGDILLSAVGSAKSSTITSIKPVENTGLYAPLTANGKLVVNDVAVSSYIALQDTDKEHVQLLTSNGKKAVNLMSHGQFAHLYLSPFRMMCIGVSPSLCQMYDSDGIPHFIGFGMKFFQWAVETQSPWVQMLLFVLIMPLLAVTWAVEGIFGPTVGLLVILSMVVFMWHGRAPITVKKNRQKMA